MQLTHIQQKALDFVKHHTKETGLPPTLRELCDFMGYSAVGSAQDLVEALRKKGALERPRKGTARGLIVNKRKRHPTVRKKSQQEEGVTFVPCLGTVPAGYPLEAIENHRGHLAISATLLSRAEAYQQSLYSLQAQGESMIKAGIHDGDWLIVKAQSEANQGEIVVAQVGHEATVKTLMKDSTKGWYLRPENDSFSPIYASETNFHVIGKVIALQRALI